MQHVTPTTGAPPTGTREMSTLLTPGMAKQQTRQSVKMVGLA